MPPFSKQCLLATNNLAFYKTRQLATSLPKVPCPAWVSGLFFWKEMRFILSIKIPVVTPSTSNWSVTPKWQIKDWDFVHTGHRYRTWNSGILAIQVLFSKLRQSYVPFWQKVITVIVARFPKLKLCRTPWGSGVPICSVWSISCL